jgi:triosephosphate isomerase
MKLVIGNWKMYPKTAVEARSIIAGVKRAAARNNRVRTIICPPIPFVHLLSRSPGVIKVGTQNCFSEDEGAYTGETSPVQLSSLGVTHVILGHSERRAFGETNEAIAKKMAAALRNKLTVILCVGERDRDENGNYFNEVKEQLMGSLAGFPKREYKRLIIAYEPIWAIGSKAVRVATPSDHREMSIHIKKHLVQIFGKVHGFSIPILYGGSVNDLNALGFLVEGKADGFLIGRVSLDPVKLGAIIDLANSLK